jgi:hypothetical protein
MTTKKQIEANKSNALLSTGAVTEEGKAVVSKNAVKHGIFTQDLIISSGEGKESKEEYLELLNNLIESLNPSGQMEHLLVEKIAVDFWRLRRVLRFETGSIRKYLDMATFDYYNEKNFDGENENRKNDEIDKEIDEQQGYLDWNIPCIKALKKGIINLDNPTWKGEDLESNLVNELYDVIREDEDRILEAEESLPFEEGELELPQLRAILKREGYTDKDIADVLIVKYEKENEEYKKKIYNLGQEKLKNRSAEEVNIKTGSLPDGASTEKVMRYEKSIQKSILQNLSVLKKLQSLP